MAIILSLSQFLFGILMGICIPGLCALVVGFTLGMFRVFRKWKNPNTQNTGILKLRGLFKVKEFNRLPSPCWVYQASLYPKANEHATIYRDDKLGVQLQVHEKYGSTGYRLRGIYYFIDHQVGVYKNEDELLYALWQVVTK